MLRLASTPSDLEIVRQLFREYAAELDIDLCFQGFEEELAGLPGKYAPPHGALLLVFEGEAPIACGALRPLEDGICELKRIYVRPSHRGTGLGRQITLDLMSRAREAGYQRVRLDTLGKLIAAQNLYRSLGFEEIEPYSLDPGLGIVYFERGL